MHLPLNLSAVNIIETSPAFTQITLGKITLFYPNSEASVCVISMSNISSFVQHVAATAQLL